MNSKKRSRAIIWLFIICLALGLVSLDATIQKNHLTQEVVELNQEVSKLKQQNDTLSSQNLEHLENIESLEQMRDTLIDSRDELKTRLDKISPEYNFYHEHAAIVVAYSGQKYHKYNCYHTAGKSIYIYNVEAAKSRGYAPCEDCLPTYSSRVEKFLAEANIDYNSISTTVYVTRTGSKYHSAGCQYLSQSQIAKTLSDAKAAGYTACSKCSPPR